MIAPVATELPTRGFAQYTVAINLCGMFAVALLSGVLFDVTPETAWLRSREGTAANRLRELVPLLEG